MTQWQKAISKDLDSNLNFNPETGYKQDTLKKLIFRKFVKNKLAVIGVVLLFFIVSVALLAPVLTPYQPETINVTNKLEPPGGEHFFGTDTLGRDTYTRLLYGARISLLVGFASKAGSIFIGVVVGAVAGYFGGRVDAWIMRVIDVIIAFPQIFLLITLVTIFDPGIDKLILAFALFGWTGTARLVRGEFLSLRSREFVLAARTMGVNSSRIIFSHLLPNAMGPIIVSATLMVSNVILAESALSYLGLGVQPPTSSWGNMLQDAQNLTIMTNAWWYPMFPGILILLTVLAFNFIGDGLRDAFDPKMKE